MMIETQYMVRKPTPKKGIVESEELLGAELFLYDESTGGIHTLNSGAAIIWLLCDGMRDLDTIAAEIGSASLIPTDSVLPQVIEIVAQFDTLGLLEE